MLRFGLVDLRRVQLGILVQLGVVFGGDIDAVFLSSGLRQEPWGVNTASACVDKRMTGDVGRTRRSFLSPSISATYSLMSPFFVIFWLTSGRFMIRVARIA